MTKEETVNMANLYLHLSFKFRMSRKFLISNLFYITASRMLKKII